MSIVDTALNAIVATHPMSGMQAERDARSAIIAIVNAVTVDRTSTDIWNEMVVEAAKGPL
jgi:hypothetical protein